MSDIKTFSFDDDGLEKIKHTKYGMNWPVVYLINNDKEIYVGESSNVFNRTKNHLSNEERKNLKELNIIYDSKFNKSAILDIESLLIQYMSADKKFVLQNKNGGQSQSHDYYQRQMYLDEFETLWRQLKKIKLVNQDINVIKNSDLFKFSPYKTLTTDQYNTAQSILMDILENYCKENIPYIINGSAGTGKTVLAVYLVKLINDCVNETYNMEDLEEYDEIYNYLTMLKNMPKFEIGLVIPMTSLRATLKKVFSEVKGLKASMVIGPNEVTKKDYDLLIVDEAHRLKRRVNLTGYASFDKTNKLLGLDNNGTELDWILKSSKYQILFYDEKQSVKPTDIRKEKFEELRNQTGTREYYLNSQLRVLGGNDYINYIKQLFSNIPPKQKIEFENYDLKMFENLDKMISEIKNKDSVYGLSRTVAGYSWKWVTKGMKYNQIINENIYDYMIDGHKCIWNTEASNWVNSENALNEIGCIHTIQGYDLNYTGVIIGNEITYNEKTKQIEVIPGNYYDINGKRGVSDLNDLRNYIIDIYNVLMTRGIRGTYVYVCDEKLRNYLKQYI